MITRWDERYAEDGFVFGTAPNDFLRAQAHRIAGKGKRGRDKGRDRRRVLCLGDGEGRNGVWLAEQGYSVTSVDLSQVGLEKTRALAAERGVAIETIFADLADYPIEPAAWSGIVSIFCHTPTEIRVPLHRRVVDGLTEGGLFILEGYHSDQIKNETGGPSDPELLITAATIQQELDGLDIILTRDIKREVIEGTHHTGQAAVTQLLARRR